MDEIDDEQVAEFRSLLEELRKQLLDACTHFDIWFQLYPTEQKVEVINRYKGFFQPARNAHLDRLYIKICNVISSDSRAPSFYRIFKMLNNHPTLASGIDVRLLRKRLRQHDKVLKKINDYRNKRVAHWDIETEESPRPLFGETEQMLKDLQDIFNQISGAHSANVWSFKYIQQGDTTNLLNALKTSYGGRDGRKLH